MEILLLTLYQQVLTLLTLLVQQTALQQSQVLLEPTILLEHWFTKVVLTAALILVLPQ